VKSSEETPCSSCPYREDAPLGLWHPSEFDRLAQEDALPLGVAYHCHKGRRLAPEARTLCRGWLLDQRARGLPSLTLRILMLRDPSVARLVRRAHAGGARLYPSIEAMRKAQG